MPEMRKTGPPKENVELRLFGRIQVQVVCQLGFGLFGVLLLELLFLLVLTPG